MTGGVYKPALFNRPILAGPISAARDVLRAP